MPIWRLIVFPPSHSTCTGVLEMKKRFLLLLDLIEESYEIQ